MHKTISLCPTCYKEIPAIIYSNGQKALMKKVCPEHGSFESVVENDYSWWNFCNTQANKGIYDGYFIDLTSRCNLKCKYCLHDQVGQDRDITKILNELEDDIVGKSLPVIFFGGEPTIHKDFFDICESVKKRFGEISVVTNGTMTADKDFFKRTAGYMMRDENTASIHVSIHKESNGADIQTIDNARAQGIKISSILYVIDSIEEIAEAVEFFIEYSDVVNSMRLKAAINVWAESSVPDRIFVSDIIKELGNLGKVEMIENGSNQVSFANVSLDGLHIMPVTWYGIDNVDLVDIDCAPWYRAKDGVPYNLLTSFLVNEGINKGYYRGKRLENTSCAA